jgi:hypothetical protein
MFSHAMVRSLCVQIDHIVQQYEYGYQADSKDITGWLQVGQRL